MMSNKKLHYYSISLKGKRKQMFYTIERCSSTDVAIPLKGEMKGRVAIESGSPQTPPNASLTDHGARNKINPSPPSVFLLKYEGRSVTCTRTLFFSFNPLSVNIYTYIFTRHVLELVHIAKT